MIIETEDGGSVKFRGGHAEYRPPAAPEMFRAVCPKCGGDVAEANIVWCWSEMRVLVNSDGTRAVEDMGDTEVCWDSIRAEDESKPLGCRSCVSYFTLDEVTLEPEGR